MNSLICKVIVSALTLVFIVPVAFSKNGQADLDAFVSDFVVAVSEADESWLASHVDIARLLEKIADNADIEALNASEVRAGFEEAMKRRFSQSLIAELKHHKGYANFLEYIQFDGAKRPIIRFNFPDGMMNYLILEVNEDEQNRFRLSDIFYASTGQYFSEMMSNVLSLSIDSGTSILDKIQGKKSFNQEMTKIFSQVAEYRLSGEYQKAYDALASLPQEVRHNDQILQISYGLASSLDEELYKKELSNLIEHSSSKKNKEFLLIDYYFFKEDYKKAIEVIDLFEEKYVEDGAINFLRSNLYYLDGDLDGAIWSAVRCNALEPTYEECYWNLVAFYAETKNFDKLVEQIMILESAFGYEFDIESMKSEPIYSDFIKSRAYKEWKNDQSY